MSASSGLLAPTELAFTPLGCVMGRGQCRALVPEGNLDCQPPISPCVLRLVHQRPPGQGTEDAASGRAVPTCDARAPRGDEYLRLVAAGDDLTHPTPRLAKALQADQQTAARMANRMRQRRR